MGYSILEYVLRCLRQQGLTADIAYPGQKFPTITGPVVTVHINSVDRANLLVTVEVSVICPASVGGTQCEMEALRVTEILRWNKAVCVQNGCRYDGIAQVYVVEILATFNGVTEADQCKVWPGFYVYMGDELLRYAISFQEEETTGIQAEYATGEYLGKGVSQRKRGWNIQLEELIPVGSVEAPEPEGEFTLQVVTDQKTEQYTGCRWTQIRREFSGKGIRRIRTGFAFLREEVQA